VSHAGLLYFVQMLIDGSLLHICDSQAREIKVLLLATAWRFCFSLGLHIEASEGSSTHGVSDTPRRCPASHRSGCSHCTAIRRYTAAPWPFRSSTSSIWYMRFRDQRYRTANRSVLLILEHLRSRKTVSCLHVCTLTVTRSKVLTAVNDRTKIMAV
jgi:hypothetical protein